MLNIFGIIAKGYQMVTREITKGFFNVNSIRKYKPGLKRNQLLFYNLLQ